MNDQVRSISMQDINTYFSDGEAGALWTSFDETRVILGQRLSESAVADIHVTVNLGYTSFEERPKEHVMVPITTEADLWQIADAQTYYVNAAGIVFRSCEDVHYLVEAAQFYDNIVVLRTLVGAMRAMLNPSQSTAEARSAHPHGEEQSPRAYESVALEPPHWNFL